MDDLGSLWRPALIVESRVFFFIMAEVAVCMTELYESYIEHEDWIPGVRRRHEVWNVF